MERNVVFSLLPLVCGLMVVPIQAHAAESADPRPAAPVQWGPGESAERLSRSSHKSDFFALSNQFISTTSWGREKSRDDSAMIAPLTRAAAVLANSQIAAAATRPGSERIAVSGQPTSARASETPIPEEMAGAGFRGSRWPLHRR